MSPLPPPRENGGKTAKWVVEASHPYNPFCVFFFPLTRGDLRRTFRLQNYASREVSDGPGGPGKCIFQFVWKVLGSKRVWNR